MLIRWPAVMIALSYALAMQAFGWTAPLEISNGGSGQEPSVPRIVAGTSGRVLVVYQQKPAWQIFYREKSTAGNWGPIEVISANGLFTHRPDVAEDTAGRVHVVYPATGAGGTLDLIHAIKQNGTWTTTPLTVTSSHYEDYPRLARDGLGRIHLVYAKSPGDRQPGNVTHRIWNGSWSGEVTVGQFNDPFYQRPSLSVDPNNNVHAAWLADSGGAKIIRYARYNGSGWTPQAPIGSTDAVTTWLSFVSIAAATSNHVMVVAHGGTSNDGKNVMHVSSTNGGANWSTLQTLMNGHYPSLDAGGGLVHLVANNEPGSHNINYRSWNGATWSATQAAWPSGGGWKGWPDVAVDAQGGVHIVADDTVSDVHRISYVTSVNDTTPPAQVSNFTAVSAVGSALLTWTNPADPDFKGTMIRFSTTGFPANPNQGTLLANRTASPGSNDSVSHTGMTNGVTYYYAAFTYDTGNNFSTAATTTAFPTVKPDFDRDGDVDQSDFGHLQECLSGAAVAQNLASCQNAKLDNDNDVDQSDLLILLNCYSGPGITAVSNCAG